MPMGKGTYGKKRGRPKKKMKIKKGRKKMKSSRGLTGRRYAKKWKKWHIGIVYVTKIIYVTLVMKLRNIKNRSQHMQEGAKSLKSAILALKCDFSIISHLKAQKQNDRHKRKVNLGNI